MAHTSNLRSSNALRLFGGVLLVAVLAGAALSVWAQAGPAGHRGPGMMGMPMQGRMVEHMLDRVNASPEQRAQVKQIVAAAAADLKAQRQAGQALHEQAAALFVQPVVDPAAAEALRQKMLQQHDQASRRMLQAMLDVSRVLTPEQRVQIAQSMAKRREMMQHHLQERSAVDNAPMKK